MLLEEINRTAITKYTDLRNLAVNLNRTLTEYNDICKYFNTYITKIVISVQPIVLFSHMYVNIVEDVLKYAI